MPPEKESVYHSRRAPGPPKNEDKADFENRSKRYWANFIPFLSLQIVEGLIKNVIFNTPQGAMADTPYLTKVLGWIRFCNPAKKAIFLRIKEGKHKTTYFQPVGWRCWNCFSTTENAPYTEHPRNRYRGKKVPEHFFCALV